MSTRTRILLLLTTALTAWPGLPAAADVVGVEQGDETLLGEPLDPAKRYAVASSAFLANGGDGYAMLAAGKPVRQSEDRMSRSFLEFFKAQGNVQVPAVGRQRDLARNP